MNVETQSSSKINFVFQMVLRILFSWDIEVLFDKRHLIKKNKSEEECKYLYQKVYATMIK